MTRMNRNPTTILRVTFGIVWLVDAFFKWQPGFRDGFGAMIQGTMNGQPGIVKPWFQLWALIAAHTGQLLPDISAITETALGVALVLGLARRPVYVLGAIYAVFVWAVGEGFGGPYVLGTSTDVGAALIYALVFACLLALDSRVAVAHLRLQRVPVATRPGVDLPLAYASREGATALRTGDVAR